MKLSEAFIGNRLAGAQRGSDRVWSIVHRSRGGFHLSRYMTNAQGHQASDLWTFPNLYELLLFAQAQGFAEVDPDAEDWQPAYGAS